MKTETKTQHTPTPWKIRVPFPRTVAEKHMKVEGRTILLMRDNTVGGGWDGENVAQVYGNSHATDLENAAFIVRAVNSYEESMFRMEKMRGENHRKDQDIQKLKLAAQKLRDRVQHMEIMHGTALSNLDFEGWARVGNAVVEIGEAIAQAEGK